jgi:hypothetical protein
MFSWAMSANFFVFHILIMNQHVWVRTIPAAR